MLTFFRAALVALLPLAATADPLIGPIRVIDGDTLDVGGVRVRLFGIDAPELDQRCGTASAPMWACGAWAAAEVRARYQGRAATCAQIETDRYGRTVARCTVDGQDMGRALVRDGLAFAFRRYSMDYDLDEKIAAVQGRGLHGAGVQPPDAFRATARAAAAAASLADAPEGCTIKGNISSDGKRIYHRPGQRNYDETRIDTRRGERWFCTPEDAESAGWRAARR
ncbi:MAG: thermonuclease family protein [Roseivivax sp.]|nr:thermonuclease family protein [Roseivivax sp.]